MKKIVYSLMFVLALAGCAVKKDDNIMTKAFKHTLNSPLYVGKALNDGVKLAIIVPIALAAKGVKVLKGEDNNTTIEDNNVTKN
jgi:hypothetical protein